jgi:hypothetical protein
MNEFGTAQGLDFLRDHRGHSGARCLLVRWPLGGQQLWRAGQWGSW